MDQMYPLLFSPEPDKAPAAGPPDEAPVAEPRPAAADPASPWDKLAKEQYDAAVAAIMWRAMHGGC